MSASDVHQLANRINANKVFLAKLAKQSRKSVDGFVQHMATGKVRGTRAEQVRKDYQKYLDEEAAIKQLIGDGEETKDEGVVPMIVSTVLGADDLPLNVRQIEEALSETKFDDHPLGSVESQIEQVRRGGNNLDLLSRSEMIAEVRKLREHAVGKYAGYNRMTTTQLRKLLTE